MAKDNLPTDSEIRDLAAKYFEENKTCSFNFNGDCNVNPTFKEDIINLVKKYRGGLLKISG